ncbi:carboxylesterase hlo [Aspergillus bombycis]|uniref:Carboxylic ester hydrolase n=1 Tax=Aspergillus bombycis TaxID=109264 RepID=A0A1F8A8W7_9EURO|nr:carboxylesterase hlo [Aspergillus bombycis]OGM48131.1 carboxylesterase hlo [Aspergillus bombycis]
MVRLGWCEQFVIHHGSFDAVFPRPSREYSLSSPVNQTHSHPTVTIDAGVVAGTTTSISSSTVTVNQFLGIPFGAPPVRFSPPKPPAPWSSVYDASKYKSDCIQQFIYPEASRNRTIGVSNTPPPRGGEESEDCLHLNIFTPQAAPETSKAVLFWIYGGSFSFGASSLPSYDGTSLAANQDVVVVTSNYRTNVFGFPGSPDLPPSQWNLGLLDQRLALDWVQRNIAAFGGDPSKVTIVGQSAGSMSVDALITSPPDPVPFRAAIMESGEATLLAFMAGSDWKALVNATNCQNKNELECVRAIPAKRLKEIAERKMLTFTPIPDGITWPKNPHQNRLNSTNDSSKIARVPLLIGSNADECQTIVAGQNAAEARVFLSGILGNNTARLQAILKEYPLGTPGVKTERDRVAKILTEMGFQCPAQRVANDSASADIGTWLYYFNATFPNTNPLAGSGAFHAAEIDLVFGTYAQEGATKVQKELSQVIQKTWAGFAKSPSAGPGWETVPQVGIFGDGPKTEGDGVTQGLFQTVDAKELHQRCQLYQSGFT